MPSTSFAVCVHNGNDGTCGTSAGGSGGPAGGGTTTAAPGQSPSTVIAARIGSLLDSHVYARGKAPRVLSGTVTTGAPLQEVELRLTRRGPQGRCSYFDGPTGRFHAMRCGAANGRYFRASNQKLFSYLLPETLAPGRYVLDVAGRRCRRSSQPVGARREQDRVLCQVDNARRRSRLHLRGVVRPRLSNRVTTAGVAAVSWPPRSPAVASAPARRRRACT